MISVLQNCKRCNTAIAYSKINKEKGVYHCNNCDVISSIYDEREYKPIHNKAPKPEDVRHIIDQNEITLELPSSKMRLPNFKQPGCIISIVAWMLFVLIMNFNMTVNGVSQGIKYKLPAFLIACVITGIAIAYINKKQQQKLYVQINPFLFTIYQIKDAQKIILESFPSYMIDQLMVKNLNSNNGKDNVKVINLGRGAGELYALNVFTKDQKMKEILRGYVKFLPHFKFIESCIESYLGIRDRKVSGEA